MSLGWTARSRAEIGPVVRLALVGVIVACAVAGNGLAFAQTTANDDPVPGYRQAIDRAVEEYEDANFNEARALFYRAHELYPNARTLRGLGMVEFELKRYAESIALLEQALESRVRALDPALRAQTQGLLARAEGFVARYLVALRPQPDAPRVTVDGAEVALVPGRALTLAVGEHLIEVRAEGYRDEKRALSVKGGERESLTIGLRPARQAPALATGAAPAPAKDEGSVWSSPWLWTGIGAVLVGGAITAVVVAGSGDDSALEGGDVGGVVMTLGRAP